MQVTCWEYNEMWKITMGFVCAKDIVNKKCKQNFQEGYLFVNYQFEYRGDLRAIL
jgi:hypothetical protein